jgi:tetratricopeptide (TPR) repeat protein
MGSGRIGSGRLVALLVATGVLVTVVLVVSSGADPVAPAPTSTARSATPLAGVPLVAIDLPAGVPAGATRADVEKLVAAEPGRGDLQLELGTLALQAADTVGARAAFERARTLGVPAAEVALAVAGYDPKAPDETIARLNVAAGSPALAPFARYEVGVVQVWAGRTHAAVATLTAVRNAAPESFYGVKADDLLHPGDIPGYPPFIARAADPAGATLASLKATAASSPMSLVAQLAYGAALLQAGRRHEALVVFRHAFAIEPESVDAQVAVAIASFSKDAPAASVGQVGPLVRDHPDDPLPRFHLAWMLLWIGLKERGRAELTQVASTSPTTPYGQLAAAIVARTG